MQVYKTKNLYILNRFPAHIKDNKLVYFIYGKGYLKTTSFELLPDELPDIWDEKLSWLDIAKIADKYGLLVGEEYAGTKVAGIIARQTIRGVLSKWKVIKKFIINVDSKLFDCIIMDYTLAVFGFDLLNIEATDREFSRTDAEYDSINSTYKGEPCSMSEYVEAKYGSRYVNAINSLINMSLEI